MSPLPSRTQLDGEGNLHPRRAAPDPQMAPPTGVRPAASTSSNAPTKGVSLPRPPPQPAGGALDGWF